MATGLADKDLTDQIIAAAIAVHRELGPGYLESIYEEALCVEFDLRGIPYERQKVVEVLYAGRKVGEHRFDLFVFGRVVVELKAVRSLEPIHFSVVRSYMKAVDVETGLLLNFAAMPLTVKRVGRECTSSVPEFLPSRLSECGTQESRNGDGEEVPAS